MDYSQAQFASLKSFARIQCPRLSEIELTEKLLADAGGWQAMKEARGIHKAGRVLAASWEPPRLVGEVQGGAGPLKSGLIINDEIDIENLCTCMENRRWGRICGHSIAVGLQILHPPKEIESKAEDVAPVAKSIRLEECLNLADLPKDGDVAELHIIIPPNFDTALLGGKATLCFEFEESGKRRPLNLVPQCKPLWWSDGDRAVLQHLVERTDGELPSILPHDLGEFGELLSQLAGSENVTLGRKASASISAEPYPLRMRAKLHDDGEISLGAELPEPAPMILPGAEFWTFAEDVFRRLDLPPGGAALLQGSQRLKREQVAGFLESQYPLMMSAGSLDADFDLTDFQFVAGDPVIRLGLEGGLARLKATLNAGYDDLIFDLSESALNGSWMPLDDRPKSYLRRAVQIEQEAVARLVRNGFVGPDKNGQWELRGENEVLRFFAIEYPRLQKLWEVSLQERLDWALDKKVERIVPACEFTPSGEEWFDFAVKYSTDAGERFSNADIQRLVLGGQSHTKLKNGKIGLLDTGAVEEFQEALVDAAPDQTDAGYRLRSEQTDFIASTVGGRNGWQVSLPKAWQRRSDETAIAELGPLQKVLRPYQVEGARWLLKLRAKGFGGILADEMGLGKTIQTLAALGATRRSSGEKSRPCLVICPTTLVFNWAAEAEKYTPELKVLVLQGSKRMERFKEIDTHDLVVTSYALIRRDWDVYDTQEFDTVVLDEAQHIKNRKTQNAQAVKAIKCHHRLVLTGTPMENSVLDLWSIFDFLMPNYLGAAQDFRERYELPLSKGPDPGLQERLGRRVKPFILRRLKCDVAKDLPDKLEQVSYCELTSQQRGVYQQVLEAGRKEVLDAVGKDGFGKSKMVIFNALLLMRQVCCDLRLLKLDEIDAAGASGKLDLFGELLEEVMDGGHRVLVFSQFTSMLDLLAERLEEVETDHCRLDGSTRNRGEVVSRFQSSDIPVFLISLKAGGVGLNLTGADTVVHFDPWWNPAIEDQATDRAHRIGQQNVVTSYKLIARDTVEEKILRLQEKKRDAIRMIFGEGEAMTDALTWEEVRELFN